MLFNSYIFVFCFLPLSILGYFGLNKIEKYKEAECFLIGMSLWFYAYFNIYYLPIIVLSIVLNFGLVKVFKIFDQEIIKKVLLVIGITGNLGVLFYYKYMGFFVQNINVLFQTDYTVVNLLLPLGISFFTFQQLSFVIDSYRGTVPQYSFRQYALFVTFFPQLIAGPIVLHSELVPQFETTNKKKFNADNFSVGLMAFSCGMGKKVLIADALGNVVNYGFSNVGELGSTNAIFVMLCYTLQIYFDFSGYCDMATGIGKMFNIDIPMNFNSPYKALSVTEFWKRWHITLTRFLRTYVYFSLGGNRKGKIRTYINLFTVFIVSGLWHGANYTFIVWGVIHGIAMIFEKICGDKLDKLHPAFRWITTFAFVNVAWIFFRADSITQALVFIKDIIKFEFGSLSTTMIDTMNLLEITTILDKFGRVGNYLVNTYPIYIMFGLLVGVLILNNTNDKINNFGYNVKNAVFSAIILVWCIISFSGISTFLYFNF